MFKFYSNAKNVRKWTVFVRLWTSVELDSPYVENNYMQVKAVNLLHFQTLQRIYLSI